MTLAKNPYLSTQNFNPRYNFVSSVQIRNCLQTDLSPSTTDITIQNNPHYIVRKNSFFLDKVQHDHYLKNGWCKIEQVFKPDEIASFMQAYRNISAMEGVMLDNQFLNTGCLVNPEIRDRTSEHLEHFFVIEEFFRIYDCVSKPDTSIWRIEVIEYKSFDIA